MQTIEVHISITRSDASKGGDESGLIFSHEFELDVSRTESDFTRRPMKKTSPAVSPSHPNQSKASLQLKTQISNICTKRGRLITSAPKRHCKTSISSRGTRIALHTQVLCTYKT